MSYHFTARNADGSIAGDVRRTETACMCAQMAPTWEMYLEATNLEELAAHADPGCALCNGTGIDAIEEGGVFLSIGEAYGSALLCLLGVDPRGCVALPLPLARRGIMKARARFDRMAPTLAPPAFLEAFSGDTARILGTEIDFVEELRARLERLESFVLEAVAAGAELIAIH